MTKLLLRLAAFALGLGIALPAWAVCPAGLPPGVTCNGMENYTYSSPAAHQPFTSALRIPVAPSPMDDSLLYIPSNLLATLNDTQTLTNKTIDCANNICLNVPTISVALPLVLTGRLLSLSFDSTLSLISGQLHVVGGGGGGISQLTNDVLAGPGTGSQAATVVGLQNRPVSSAGPITGQFLGWNGSAWLPVTASGGVTIPNSPLVNGNGSVLGNVALGTGLSMSGSFPSQTLNATASVTGFTGQITVANACTGTSCTPVISCQTYGNGLLSSFAAGACSGVSLVARNAGGTVGRNGGGSVARN